MGAGSVTPPHQLLSAYTLATVGEPWVWGQSDCGTWVLRWVAQARGVERPQMPRHKTERGAKVAVVRAGGIVPLMDQYAARLGVERRTGEPHLGDVGVVLAADGQEVAAIFGGARWIVRRDGGWYSAPATPVAVWAVL